MKIIIGDFKVFNGMEEVLNNKGKPYFGIIFGEGSTFSGGNKNGNVDMRLLAEKLLKSVAIDADCEFSLYVKPCLYFTFKDEVECIKIVESIKNTIDLYNESSKEAIKKVVVNEEKIKKILFCK